jgi:hypothetical protein
MSLIASIGAALASKAVSILGENVVNAVLAGYRAKLDAGTATNKVFSEAFTSSLQSQVEHRKAVGDERKALMGSRAYTWLLVFCVSGPALYLNAVFVDSVFGIAGWDVLKAPPDFHQAAFQIVYAFAGVGAGGLAAIVAASKFLKGK